MHARSYLVGQQITLPVYPSIYEPQTVADLKARIEKLQPDSPRRWGKMDVAQMLAHCNVAFELTYGEKEVQYNFLMKLFLKAFVKKQVVGPKPYPRNGQTAPVFVIADERDFAKEKTRLLAYLDRMQAEGATAYEGRESPSFGPMTAEEWSVQFVKHLDHHLQQFGV